MFQNSVEVEVCGLRAKKPGRGANHAVHWLCGSLVQHPLPCSPSKTTGMVGQTNYARQITAVSIGEKAITWPKITTCHELREIG